MDTTANNTTPCFSSVHKSNMWTYVNDRMNDEIKDFVSAGQIKSGFANLDAITNIYPGLYVIGAISSLGKTTFVHQMSDQMAQNGEHVIYFSLEQSTLELASKSLSRIMGQSNYTNALTSLQVRKNIDDNRISDAITQYKSYAKNITVVECSFRATIDDIEEIIVDYIDKYKVKPIVVIDYLQVIQAPIDSKKTTKDLVDSHVRRLKEIQSDNKLVMMVISSLNRQNYLTQIDYESFKESGGIEYTADVIWGLQLTVLHDDIFNSQAKINEKREKVREAKASNPRNIELVCLKNRFGVSSYSCEFEYYPQFDMFKPILNGIDLSFSEDKDKDGFISLPVAFSCPFDQWG